MKGKKPIKNTCLLEEGIATITGKAHLVPFTVQAKVEVEDKFIRSLNYPVVNWSKCSTTNAETNKNGTACINCL